MIWIAVLVLVALAAGVLGTLLEIAMWAVVLTVLVVITGALLLMKTVGRDRSGASTTATARPRR